MSTLMVKQQEQRRASHPFNRSMSRQGAHQQSDQANDGSSHGQQIKSAMRDALPDYPRAWFYPILPWGAPVSSFPHARLRGKTRILCWEILTAAWVLYIAVEVPYRLGYGLRDNFPVCTWGWKIAIDVLSDIIFLSDIIVQMHSAFFLGNPEDGQWECVDKLPDIRRAYFQELRPWKRSFLWDFLGGFPFLQIGCGVWATRGKEGLGLDLESHRWFDFSQFVMVLSLLRLTKALRFWKIAETIEDINRNSPGYANVVAVGKLVMILFFAAHYLSCIWFSISPKADDVEEGWIFREGGIIPRSADNWMHEWIASMYWAITTMTTIGYGDISAHTVNERIFAMFGMVLGSAYFAWLAGTITGILASGSAGTERFLGFLEEVRQYMDIKRFSSEVKKMVFVFYGLKFPTQLIFNESDIMDSLPKGLKRRMQAETYMDIIEGVPLFADVSESTKMEICNAFQTYYCSKEEELTKEDEEPDCLFIVRHGDVLLTSGGDKISIARRGVMFGELSMFGFTANGRRCRTAVSLSECELLRLSKQQFKMLVVTFGDLRTSFRRLAARHLRLLESEMLDPTSPIHQSDKFIHINAAWQDGRIPEIVKLPGKVMAPVLPLGLSDNMVLTTMLHINVMEIRKFPFLCGLTGGNRMMSASITLRLQFEWDAFDGFKQIKQEFTYQQGLPCVINWRAIFKYKHTTDEEVKVICNPDVTIKLIFVKLIETPHGPTAGISADLGFSGAVQEGSSAVASRVAFAGSVKAPFKETQVGKFTMSMAKIVELVGKKKAQPVIGEWNINDQFGPLELACTTNVTREMPQNAISKVKFRSIKERLRFKETGKEGNHHSEDGKMGILPISGGMGVLPQQMRKDLWEVKMGVGNVLAKGDPGKSGATATSFERTQEKLTDEILQRMREMKEQIQGLHKYNVYFERHVNDEFLTAIETLDKRIDVVLKEQARMKDHLIEVQDRREQHALEIKNAIANADAQSRARELMIIDMLQQMAKKQGMIMSLVPPVQVQIPKVPIEMPPPRQSAYTSSSLVPTYVTPREKQETTQPSARHQHVSLGSPQPKIDTLEGEMAGVGLLLGEFTTSLGDGQGPGYTHIQVHGLLPGGAAERSGKILPGDEIIGIGGTPLMGQVKVSSARAMCMGADGSSLGMSFLRPDTNTEFQVTLIRQI